MRFSHEIEFALARIVYLRFQFSEDVDLVVVQTSAHNAFITRQ